MGTYIYVYYTVGDHDIDTNKVIICGGRGQAVGGRAGGGESITITVE